MWRLSATSWKQTAAHTFKKSAFLGGLRRIVLGCFSGIEFHVIHRCGGGGGGSGGGGGGGGGGG